MTPTTYWIARRPGTGPLMVWNKPPKPRMSGFYGDGVSYVGEVRPEHWPALGLPHEPATGECWEVRWEERKVFTGDRRFTEWRLVPIARNVTQELKEAARD